MSKLFAALCFAPFVVLTAAGPALSDGLSDKPQDTAVQSREFTTEERLPDRSSRNYERTDHLIPGEEVITPTGKKVKVWSTEDRTPEERSLEPWEDREKSVLPDGTNILIDPYRHRRHRRTRSKSHYKTLDTGRSSQTQ